PFVDHLRHGLRAAAGRTRGARGVRGGARLVRAEHVVTRDPAAIAGAAYLADVHALLERSAARGRRRHRRAPLVAARRNWLIAARGHGGGGVVRGRGRGRVRARRRGGRLGGLVE